MVLVRVANNGIATYGVLIHGGTPFAVTLERPWRDNRRGESCIPAGAYRALRCRRSPDYGYKDSPRFGDTFQVMDVPGRSEILFHRGNLEDDTHGCILVGESFNPVLGRPGITASQQGFDEFLSLLRHVDEFRLDIIEAFTRRSS
jgi:hypothetical protein